MKNVNAAVRLVQDWLNSGQLKARPAEIGGFTPIDQRQRAVFAASVESAARGILAMAKADKNRHCVHVVPPGSHLFKGSKSAGSTNMVAVFNCDHLLETELPGQELLSPDGSLKVRALTLKGSVDAERGSPAELGIVMAPRSSRFEPLDAIGYAAAFVDVHGSCLGHRHTPLAIKPNGYLAYTLGLQPLHFAVNHMDSTGHLDTALGFPMAASCLAEALPQVEGYLSGLATALAQQKVDLR